MLSAMWMTCIEFCYFAFQDIITPLTISQLTLLLSLYVCACLLVLSLLHSVCILKNFILKIKPKIWFYFEIHSVHMYIYIYVHSNTHAHTHTRIAWFPAKSINQQYHVFHSAQVFGTLVVAVVFSQLGRCEAVLVLDGQVHTVHHQDLTALWTQGKQQKHSWCCFQADKQSLNIFSHRIGLNMMLTSSSLSS